MAGRPISPNYCNARGWYTRPTQITLHSAIGSSNLMNGCPYDTQLHFCRFRSAIAMEVSKLSTLDTKRPHSFVVPVKYINEGHDVPRFLVSKAYHDIMVFTLQLNRAVFPRHVDSSNESGERIQTWELNSPTVPLSDAVCRLQGLLERLNSMVDEVPPDPGPRRFGNVAFRRWYEVLEAQLPALLAHHLPEKVSSFERASDVSVQAELRSYLLGAFGSAQRLDYGTGHELSFLAFLGCIWKLEGFNTSSKGSEERGIVLGLIEP